MSRRPNLIRSYAEVTDAAVDAVIRETQNTETKKIRSLQREGNRIKRVHSEDESKRVKYLRIVKQDRDQ